ncbi:MAG TPA: NADH-quinone oxidoreductase subunit N, partial [Bacteroidetes bacterium]|nr:NADH-quinone oxidoreductase subunit N [Bacteroidota bacterium]
MKAIIILFATAMVVLFTGISGKRTWLLPLSVLGLLAAFASLVVDAQIPVISYGGMVRFDGFGLAYSGLTVVAATLIFVLSGYFYRGLKDTLADHYGLLLFSMTGALCMFSFEHMVMLFLGIEILSIPLYVMAGSRMD